MGAGLCVSQHRLLRSVFLQVLLALVACTGAGLCVGLSSLAAGLAIGIVGDAGVRANAQEPKLFVGMILILIFAEALGLYGLIVGLVVASAASDKGEGLCSSYK